MQVLQNPLAFLSNVGSGRKVANRVAAWGRLLKPGVKDNLEQASVASSQCVNLGKFPGAQRPIGDLVQMHQHLPCVFCRIRFQGVEIVAKQVVEL
jgi:hypothetical protein